MDKKNNDKHWQKNSDTAAILHIFYLDLVDELAEKTKNLGTQCDFYISAPNDPQLMAKISQTFPDAKIIPISNRGRDILPFIEIINRILPLNYDYLIKVHTKMSVHMAHGNNWRQDVYEKLLGSEEVVQAIKSAFKNDPKLGMLGPVGHVVESRFYMGGNHPILEDLMKRFGFQGSVPEKFFFSASTMFWCRPEVLKPFLDVDFLHEEFGEEPIPADNTIAHGLERFLGLMTSYQGYKVKAVDESGHISTPDPHQTIRFVGLPTAFRLHEMKTLVFFRNLKEISTSEQYRITVPYKLAGMQIVDGVHDGKYSPELVNSVDALILQCKFHGDFVDYAQIYNAAIQYHRPMICDVDELIFDSSINNEDFGPIVPSFLAVLDADLVITSTPKLKETLSLFNPNTTVFPDYLDDRVWKFKTIQPKEDDSVLISYIGSEKDQADLESIAPALKFLLIKYAPTLQFELIGTPLPKCLEGIPGVSWKALPTTEHEAFAAFCQKQPADIFVAPLLSNLYNDCKSPIKFFEHSAMGVPGVYSALTPYKDTITDGVDGYLANNLSDWIQYLETLVLNPTLRYKMAKAAQDKVKKQYLLSDNVHSLNDIIGEIVPDKIVDRASKATQASYLQKTVKKVLQSNNKPNYYGLVNELVEARAALQASRNEVEQYRSSTSWKITRPMRKFSEYFRKR